MKNTILLFAAVLLVACTNSGSKTGQIQEAKPNFIVILTDDQGWACMSGKMDDNYLESKSDYYETPNIDRLAKMGMRFTSGYAPAALCSPTRRAIQFGQTPIRQGDDGFKAKYHPDNQKRLTIPEVLQKASLSYRTAHYGKWDLRGDIFPEDLGYHESDGNTGNNNGDYGSSKQTKWIDYFPSKDPKRIESLTQRTMNFIERNTRSGNPFYVQLSHYATHVDMQAKQETYDKFVKKEKGIKHSHPAWAAMLGDLDTGIGQLLDKVESLGIADNTYIIFTTDNGAAESIPPISNKLDHPSTYGRLMRNHPLRGGKWVTYEGGIRVPFMVVGPGVKKSSQSDVPVGGWDILPTVADLSGSQTILKDDLDGGSIAVLFKDGTGKVARNNEALFFHRYKAANSHSAVRLGNYKLMKFWKTGKLELFDLSKDLGEAHDIAANFPKKVKDLDERLLDYIRDVDAEILSLVSGK